MILRILTALCFTALCLSAEAQTWLSQIFYETPIIIPYTKISGGANLTDFPVLVNLTNSAWAIRGYGGHVSHVTGADIFFLAADKTTILPHEIESYNDTTGALVAWVKAPTVSYTANTTIYMRYGDLPQTNRWNPQGVWTGYRMVNHLSNARLNGTLTRDSSPMWQDGTKVSDISPTQAAGQIGNGQSFNGTSDYIGCSAGRVIPISWPVWGNVYFSKMLSTSNLVYAVGRNTTFPGSTGASEVDPFGEQTIFYWHDSSWVSGNGPESIWKNTDGTYLIGDEDGASRFYTMNPLDHTKTWTQSSYGNTRPISLGGTNCIVAFETGGSGQVTVYKTSDRSVLWQTNSYTYANNGDYRVINGTNYLSVADYLAHKLYLYNMDTYSVDWVATLGVSSGPFDAEFIDDNRLLVADGSDFKISIFTLSPNATNWQSVVVSSGATTIHASMLDSKWALVSCATPAVYRVDTTDANGYTDNLRFTGNLTLSCWANPSGSGIREFIDKYICYELYCNNQTLTAILNDAKVVNWGSQVTNSVWSYYAVTYDGANITLYNNGVAGTPSAYSTAISTTQNSYLTIGKQGGGAAHYYSGLMDEVRVANAVLTQGWLQTEYNNQRDPGSFCVPGVETLIR